MPTITPISLTPSTRTVTYTVPVATAGPFSVPFPLFEGVGDDLVVLLNGTTVPRVGNWTLTATPPGPSFPAAVNTWLDGSITFSVAVTGTLTITGRRTPRREALRQFVEGRGVGARELNSAFNEVVAVQQEFRRDLDQLDPLEIQAAADAAVAAAAAATAAIAVQTLPPGTAMNTVIAPGRYSILDPVGLPAGTWVVEVMASPADPDSVLQTAQRANGGTDAQLQARRRDFSGAWSGWTTPFDAFAGDSGSGGGRGLVPGPAAGDAAAGRVLGAGGGWVSVSLSGLGDVNTARRANGKGLWWDAATLRHVYAWASPRDATLDLRDLMDEHYGVGSWTQRTGVNTGSNIVPAIELGAARFKAAGVYGKIVIPPGIWLKTTAFNTTTMAGVSLVGATTSAGCVIVDATTGNFLHATGAGGYGSAVYEHLSVLKEDGFSGGTCLLFQGDASLQPGQLTVRDIYATALGTGRWGVGLLVDGTLKTTGAQGVRVFHMENLQLFQTGAANAYAAGFFNAVQGSVVNIGTYGGTGTLANWFGVGGLGTTVSNTSQLTVDRLIGGGELSCSNSTRVRVDGACGLLNVAASADFWNGWVDATSQAGAFGANSNVTVR